MSSQVARRVAFPSTAATSLAGTLIRGRTVAMLSTFWRRSNHLVGGVSSYIGCAMTSQPLNQAVYYCRGVFLFCRSTYRGVRLGIGVRLHGRLYRKQKKRTKFLSCTFYPVRPVDNSSICRKFVYVNFMNTLCTVQVQELI